MLKITKVQRTITEKEFLKLKKFLPFERYRHVAKSINFALIFSATARTFVKTFLETAWSVEQCEEYIDQYHLKSLFDSIVDRSNGRDSIKFCKYLAVATDIRNKFFNAYKALTSRCENQHRIAQELGYVRSPFGAIRKIPELLLAGKHDEKINKHFLSNKLNISNNTDIQNIESVIVNSAIIEIDREIIEKKLKSRFINNVHDSIDMYIHKDEIGLVANIVYKACTKPWIEIENFPLDIDGSYGDVLAGEYYKSGKDMKEHWSGHKNKAS